MLTIVHIILLCPYSQISELRLALSVGSVSYATVSYTCKVVRYSVIISMLALVYVVLIQLGFCVKRQT